MLLCILALKRNFRYKRSLFNVIKCFRDKYQEYFTLFIAVCASYDIENIFSQAVARIAGGTDVAFNDPVYLLKFIVSITLPLPLVFHTVP